MGVVYRPPSTLPDLADAITQAPASVSLSALRAVILTDAGELAYASSDNQSHAFRFAGVLPNGYSQGDMAIAYRMGEIADAVWNWTRGSPVFLGVNGFLTQTAPTTGFLLVVGTPTSTTSLMIQPSDPIFL